MKPSLTRTEPCDSLFPRVYIRGTSNGCGRTMLVAVEEMRLISLTDLGILPGIFTPSRRIQEPVFEGNSSFSEVLFTNGVFVPCDELDSGNLIYQRVIDIEIEGSILLWKGRIQRLFDHTRLVSNGEK